MKEIIKTLTLTAVAIILASTARAQSTVVAIDNEPTPKLTVKQPLAGPLTRNVVFIPYQVENLRIMPLGGEIASKVSPRVGHLHITIDDLPWFWGDFGQSNTIIIGGLPRGQHKVLIEVVDPAGKVFTSQIVTFNTPGNEARVQIEEKKQ